MRKQNDDVDPCMQCHAKANGSPNRPELPPCRTLAGAQFPEHHAIAVHVNLFCATRLAQQYLHVTEAPVRGLAPS